MKSTALRTLLAFSISRSSGAFSPLSRSTHNAIGSSFSAQQNQNLNRNIATTNSQSSTSRFMSSGGGEPLQVTQVNKAGLNEILEDIENSSREESGYVVIDVRNEDEIAYTGKLAPCVQTLPLPFIFQMNVFNMEDDEFEETFGFAKPSMDETIVFTCKAGIRSMQAAQIAAMSGYTNLVNYSGGADDWFR